MTQTASHSYDTPARQPDAAREATAPRGARASRSMGASSQDERASECIREHEQLASRAASGWRAGVS